MNHFPRIGLLALVVGFGTTAVLSVMLVSTAVATHSTVANDAQVDLVTSTTAPRHITAGSAFVTNISYANIGAKPAPDAWVTAVLPDRTAFITSTDAFGASFPPDLIAGKVLTWHLTALPAYSQRSHILVTLLGDDLLQEGERLTTTAAIATTAVESNTLNNSASVSSIVCDMAGSTKQVQSRHVLPGGVLSYTIRVSLAQRFGGGMNGRWISLTDTLPFSHQVKFLGWRGTLTSTKMISQALRWQGRVRAGDPLTLQFQLGLGSSITPGTVITNVAMLGWREGHMLLGPVTTVVTLSKNALVVGPNQVGQLFNVHGITVTVPPGAVSDTTTFQLGPLFTDTRPFTMPPGLIFANRAFELNAFRYGQDVHRFGQPITITMRHTLTDSIGLKHETLRLWTRHGPKGPWAMLGEPVRVMSGALTFTTTHFSQFALFGQGKFSSFLPSFNR